MRVIVLGNSGSGKTVLSRSLGAHYEAEVLSLDAVFESFPGAKREFTKLAQYASIERYFSSN